MAASTLSKSLRRVRGVVRHLSSAAAAASALEVCQFPCLGDNYGFLVHDPCSGDTAAIDSPELTPYLDVLAQKGWTLTHILNTHWHPDHCGANDALRRAFPRIKVYAPAEELDKIASVSKSGVDQSLNHGDAVQLGTHRASVIDVGYHTTGHIAYHFADDGLAFVGDSLFTLGCGRMFEGTPDQAWRAMQRLRALPDSTLVYCAHEYTESNARFVESLGLNDEVLERRINDVYATRRRGEPTVPTLLGVEKRTNPFLRSDNGALREALGMASKAEWSDAQVWGETRSRKDSF